jgi:hypothetical protein
MDERKFLDKIRKMKESGKQIGLTEMKDINKNKEVINEWDEARRSPSRLLYEARIELDDNPEIQNLEPDEQREEENSFKDTVSKLVKFNKIKVHKENVEWSGSLIREKIDWVFSLDDTIGCYIDTTEFVQLRDETLETLKKLRGFYEVWSEEWGSRLTGTPTEDDEMEGIDMGEMPEGEPQGPEGPEGDFGGPDSGEGFEF